MSAAFDCDVAVIGGGPAGAAAATVLAREGFEVTVLEREHFPRFHVGESLLPLQGPILERLGVAEKVNSFGFVPKLGASFVANDGSAETFIRFVDFLEPPYDTAVQVERAEFDELLLRHAAESGARVLEGHAVADTELADGDCRLTVRARDAGQSELRCRWVIDASGQSSLLARRLGLRANDSSLRKVCHFAHYRGGRRNPGNRSGDITLVLGKGCWFWFIPLRDQAVSVGCIVDHSVWKASDQKSTDFLESRIAESPWLTEWLQGAERITQAHTVANFSYSSTSFAGPGYVLAGDAATFLDPVFSTGVLLALKSGEAAARTLVDELRSDRPLTHRAFDGYQQDLREWTRHYFRLIRAFYDPKFASVFFNPVLSFQRPIVRFLAGRTELSWLTRAKLEIFYAFIRLNHFITIARDPRDPAAKGHHG